jgi:glycosyltransferase involved in cell wall biosynthesis
VKEGLVMVCDVDVGLPDATRTHTLEVARCFAREGFDVDLVTRGSDPGLDSVRHLRIQSAIRPRTARVTTLNATAIALLWKRRRSARRLYVRNDWTILPILLAGRILGYRVVTQVDDMPFGRGFEREIGLLYDYGRRAGTYLMGQLAHGIVAVTPQLRWLLVDLFRVPPDRIVVLPNGVDTEFIRPLSREEAIGRARLEPSFRYIIFCGNLATWVDFDMLIGAFAIVARARPDARLLMVGGGAEQDRLARLVDQSGLRDHVIMTGFVEDRLRVRDYLASSTVAVTAHANDYINRIGVSPTKLAEYMAAGRAVVVKDVPGLADVLQLADCGIAVRGVQEMADALLVLLDQERADALGVNGRRLAEDRFTWHSIVHRTVPLFGLQHRVVPDGSNLATPTP